jgi:hypothetical protein
MSEEIKDEMLTIPDGEPPKDQTKQAIVRLHKHDHVSMKVMLKKDKMSFQKFVAFCVRAYLDGDPQMLKMIKSYRELESVPRDFQEKHVLSSRERASILDEIEKGAASGS